MKRLTSIALVVAALAIASAPGQTQGPTEQQQIAASIKNIQAQQVKIAANQAQIETKLAALAEAIRLARIYAARGGGK